MWLSLMKREGQIPPIHSKERRRGEERWKIMIEITVEEGITDERMALPLAPKQQESP
jgi:hypothetical protein